MRTKRIRELLDNVSVTSKDLRRQITISFALMTILPMLTLGYFLCRYLMPNIKIPENLPGIILLTFVLSLLGFTILKRIAISISKLGRHIAAIANGDLTHVIEVHNGSEIAKIGNSLSLILQRLRRDRQELEELTEELKKAVAERTKELEELKSTQAMLLRSEKMATVGQLASGVAHEVKNPLQIIMQGINYLETQTDKGKKAEVFGMIKQAVTRADKIIRGLLSFSRVSASEPRHCEVNNIIETSLQLTEKQLTLGNIKTTRDFTAGLPLVLIDGNQMQQVFINIFLNSLQAMPNGGELTIRTYAKQPEELGDIISTTARDLFRRNQMVLVCEVEDTGTGIPEDKLGKVFEPFFTTRAPEEGVGLGLTVTRSIVEGHRGLIKIESEKGKGTKVVIVLPIHGDEAGSREKNAPRR